MPDFSSTASPTGLVRVAVESLLESVEIDGAGQVADEDARQRVGTLERDRA